MSTIINQKNTGLYGFKALGFDYQLTDTNTIEPILFIEVWMNGMLEDNNVFEVKHYVSKTNDTYTYSFNIQNILLQYFSGVESKICNLENLINQDDSFQCETFIRIYEYRENSDGELEKETSYVQSNTYNVIKSNIDDLNNFVYDSSLIDFLSNDLNTKTFNISDTKIGLAFWSKDANAVSVNGVELYNIQGNHLTILNLAKCKTITGLENDTTFNIYLRKVQNLTSGNGTALTDGSGLAVRTVNQAPVTISNTFTFALTTFCDKNNLIYFNQFGTVGNIMADIDSKGFNLDFESFTSNQEVFKYRSSNNDTINLKVDVNNDDIYSMLDLLVSNHVELLGLPLVIENKGSIQMDRNIDDIVLKCSYSAWENFI